MRLRTLLIALACSVLLAQTALAGTLAHWRFEGDLLDDTGPHGGTANGAPPPDAASFVGPVARDPIPETQAANASALLLDRVASQWIEVPHDVALARGQAPFTLEAWVWLDSLGDAAVPGTGSSLIQRKGLSGLGDSQIDYGWLAQAGARATRSAPGCGKPAAQVTGRELALEFGGYAAGNLSDDSDFTTLVSTLQLEPGDEGQWHFIAVAWDGNDTVRFTLDGRSETLSCVGGFGHLSGSTLTDDPRAITIGARATLGGALEQHFDGRVDELRLSDAYLPAHDLLHVGTALHDTFPASGPAGRPVGNGAPSDHQPAQGFVIANGGGNYRLDSIRVSTSTTAGTGLVARLWSGSAGEPKTLLEELAIPPTASDQSLTLFSAENDLLCAGETYWVSLSANDGVSTGLWQDANAPRGLHADTTDLGTQGLTWAVPGAGGNAALLTVTGEPVTSACQVSWLGGNGSWDEPTRWSSGATPDYDAYAVLIDDGLPASSVVDLDQATAVRDVILDGASQLTIANGVSLTLGFGGGGGSVVNDGVLSLASTGDPTRLFLTGPTTFTGSGSLDFGGAGNQHFLQSGGSSPEVIIPAGETLTITGDSGFLGLNTLAFSNDGLLDVASSGRVVIDPNSSGFTNAGTLRAQAGATLELDTGPYENTGGLIEALDGSSIFFTAGAEITGGIVDNVGTGALLPESARFIGVANQGSIDIANGRSLFLEGSFANDGTISLGSTGSGTWLYVTGSTSITGSGSIDFGGTSNLNYIFSGGSTPELVVPAASTLRITGDSGFIGGNTLAFANDGTFDIATTGSVILDPNSAGFTNRGTLRTQPGTVLELGAGTFDNTGGLIQALDGSSIFFGPGVEVQGGALGITGSGALLPESGRFIGVTNQGEISITNGKSLYVESSFVNEGTLTLSSDTMASHLYLTGPTSITGPGSIVFAGTSDQNLIFDGGNGAELIVPASETLRFTGQSGFVGVNTLAITNDGLIDIATSGTVTLDPNATGLTNRGTIQAQTGSSLEFGVGAYANDGGLIQALDGSTIVFGAGAEITGGVLDNSGTGELVPGTGRFIDITNQGEIEIDNGQTLYIESSFTNNGTLTLASTGSGTLLFVTGPTNISGSGPLVFGGSSDQNIIFGGGGAAELIVPGSSTLRIAGASGRIGADTLGVTNNGLIDIAASGTVTVDPNATGFDNNGTVRTQSGATLNLNAGDYVNIGGVFEALDGSTIHLRSGAEIRGGTIGQAGTGKIVPAGGALRDVTNPVDLVVGDGETLRLRNLFINDGTLTLSASSTAAWLYIDETAVLRGPGHLILSDSPTSQGLKLIRGAGVFPRLIQETDHRLTGHGLIDCYAVNSGELNPGDPIGRLEFTDDLDLLPNSDIHFEIGGSRPIIEHDVISVDATLLLSGEIFVGLVNGYGDGIQPGDVFTLMSSNNLIGSFSNAPPGSRVFVDFARSFAIHYGPGSPYGPSKVVLTDFQSGSSVTIGGVATGGTVTLVVNGVTIVITTTAGQTAAEVAEALAAAINADPTLAALGVVASAVDGELRVNGAIESITISDPGLYRENASQVAVPMGGIWMRAMVAAMLALSAALVLRGTRRRDLPDRGPARSRS